MDHQLRTLQEKIANHPNLEEAERAELLALIPGADEPRGLGEELKDVGEELSDIGTELRNLVRKFEARHPQFTQTADQVLNYLSRMGI